MVIQQGKDNMVLRRVGVIGRLSSTHKSILVTIFVQKNLVIRLIEGLIFDTYIIISHHLRPKDPSHPADRVADPDIKRDRIASLVGP